MVGEPRKRPGSDTGRSRAAFLAAALRSPLEVGTLLPSGRALARRLAAVVPREAAGQRRQVVVELGAGTGAVTVEIARRAGPGSTLIAIEKDAAMAEQLRSRGLGAEIVTADALTLPEILADHGLDRADAIVSVLPFTLLPPARQRELVEVIREALHPDGVFTAAAYSAGYWTPTARRFRDELQRSFHEVVPTRSIWDNVPPAMSYICRQPAL
ncbi:MAG: methyltransferase domain-containing protein [Pseudonocardiaceae bacterium]|nr:methyltransferase domain-containing protein [Pseudonocardiaceae bacterium]